MRTKPYDPTKIDDSVFAVPIYSDVCTLCVHQIIDGSLERKCKAFPKGIPMEIWMGENPHTQPYPGDNGIQFEDVRKKALAEAS